MKTSESVKAISVAITILILVGTFLASTLTASRQYVSENKIAIIDSKLNIKSTTKEPTDLKLNNTFTVSNVVVASGISEEEEKKKEEEIKRNTIVYDGMTLDELASKLDRTLNDTLSGQGYTFASYAIELGVDPYLALAIVMHETGCKWKCSSLLNSCNNVGGMKGVNSCNGGAYASFASLEEGIRAYMENLYKNYVSVGLTTAETMASKYAASSTWATQVNAYINEIKTA